jgi:hypothetical protein
MLTQSGLEHVQLEQGMSSYNLVHMNTKKSSLTNPLPKFPEPR